MEIPRDLKPVEPLRRRPATDNRGAGEATVGEASNDGHSVGKGDAFAPADSARVDGYVRAIGERQSDPERLDTLGRRIADGSFTAPADELADGLADRLSPPAAE